MHTPATSPSSRAATIRAGRLVVLFALLLVLASGAWCFFSFKPLTQHLVLYFEDNVSGLYTGSPVKSNGVTVGQVEAIGLRISTMPRSTEASAIKPANSAALHLVSHAEVRIAIESRKMDALGLPHDLSNPTRLNSEISAGLRGKLVLLSATTGEYGVELTHDPYVFPVLISAAEEKLAEIPTIPNMLSGEKLDTLTDAITALGQSDFPRLVLEWDSTLDSALAATSPERLAQTVHNFLTRIENAKNLFADNQVRDDLRNINEKLIDLRKTLEQAEGDSLRRAVAFHSDMARLRESLVSAGAWLTRLSAQLDADSPELQSVLQTLGAIREFAESAKPDSQRRR